MSDQELLSGLALATFKLNGQFLALAEQLAKPSGLTAAWWQVLGAVVNDPLPVAGIAREMGITRQSVQRIADLLVEKGLAEYVSNPAHKRARLVRPTPEGRSAMARINPGHAAAAGALANLMPTDELSSLLAAMQGLSAVVDQVGRHAAAAND